MKLTIERVSNGFLIKNEDDFSATVFEDKEDNDFSEKEAGYRMLWEVINYFGLRGSKHDSRRLAVIIERSEESLERDGAVSGKKLKKKQC